MKVKKHVILALSICTAFVWARAATEATALIQSWRIKDESRKGLYLSHYPSMKLTKVYPRAVKTTDFSYDGTKILFVVNDTLYTMNNDGTGIEAHFHDTFGGFGVENRRPMWTTKGIMWFADNTIQRYNPDTRKRTTLPIKFTDIASDCKDKNFATAARYIGSRDGLRSWSRAEWDPKGVDSLYCGVRGYDRGGHPHFQFSEDFSSYDVCWHSEWGHGQGMTAGGHLILVQLGSHKNLGITFQQGDKIKVLYKYYEYVPAYLDILPESDGWQSRSVPVSANNDSIIGSLCYHHEPYRCYYCFWNWRERKLLGNFTLFDSTTMHALYSPYFWYGPLPAPHDDKPYISVDKNELVLVASNQAPPAPQTVTVTNKGGGTMTKVGVTIKPSGANWLSATVEGNGGNSQSITNALTPKNLSADQATATVTVSGGGASNTASYTVYAYEATALPAPTSPAADAVGDSLLDVKLTWTDNATGESGFIIQRRADNGDWSEVGRTGANAVAYTDTHLTVGMYQYRVIAFKNLTADNVQNSAPSATVTIEVEGIPWIRVTNPIEGQMVKAGNMLTVNWSVNIVTQVYIEWSQNGGISWETITPQGGIREGTDYWGKYPWKVPNVELEGVQVRVCSYNDEDIKAKSGKFTITRSQAVKYSMATSESPLFRAKGSETSMHVEVCSAGLFDISLYSSDGRCIVRRKGRGPAIMDLPFPSGSSAVYILRCRAGKDSFSRKIITY